MASNKLEEAAILARATLIPKNLYSDASPEHNYTATHSRALADETTPEAGRGTGDANMESAIENDNAGTKTDKFGNPAILGTGRNAALTQNLAKWGMGKEPEQQYKSPDTSANVGEVVIN